jgi:DNA-binding IclR family transcriptional regulator
VRFEVSQHSSPGRRHEVAGRQPGAVLSAFAVLEEVARAGPGITARQISTNLQLPRATAYRMLNLLVQEEYLVRLPDVSGFALGRKVAQLAGVASDQNSQRDAAPILKDLRARLRGGVHLLLLRQDRVTILDEDPDFPLDPRELAGDRQNSAVGQLLLAERATNDDQPSTPFAVWGVDSVNPTVLGTLVAPIRRVDGTLVAAIALCLPVRRLLDPSALVAGMDSDMTKLAAILDF